MRARGTGDGGWILLAADDGIVRRGLERLAAGLDLEVVTAAPSAPGDVGDGRPSPAAVVVDAGQAPATIAAWHDRFPDSPLIGVIAVPDRSRWTAAERAGCDIVVNRGAVAHEVRNCLRTSPRKRHPLADSSDLAGRLGLLVRIDDSPVGPLALFRVGASLVAITDACPHAGAPLSTGRVEGTVLTCQRHGSQFDLMTGQRVRGPADDELRRHRVVEEGGRVWLVL